ncbi:MAG: 3-methyl-2-oxobutanoate dehydrogenase subunit beta, partial [Candidatus Caldatribacteriaceae bacterium]
FYLADKYRNPALILGDGMLAQMMEPVSFREPDLPPLPPKDWAIQGKGKRERRFIVCFALDPQELEELNVKLQKKYRLMEEQETDFEVFGEEDPELLFVGFGTVGRILKTVVREGKKQGMKLALFRPITLFPFPHRQIKEKAREAGKVLVVEMNLGQMVEDVRLSVEGEVPVHFYGRTGGMIPKVEDILKEVRQILRDEVHHESCF